MELFRQWEARGSRESSEPSGWRSAAILFQYNITLNLKPVALAGRAKPCFIPPWRLKHSVTVVISGPRRLKTMQLSFILAPRASEAPPEGVAALAWDRRQFWPSEAPAPARGRGPASRAPRPAGDTANLDPGVRWVGI